jgi:hypothetical protein
MVLNSTLQRPSTLSPNVKVDKQIVFHATFEWRLSGHGAILQRQRRPQVAGERLLVTRIPNTAGLKMRRLATLFCDLAAIAAILVASSAE